MRRVRRRAWTTWRRSIRMTTFSDREKEFEAKFKHDEELKFKVIVRRNKLLGLWAGELFGMDADAANAYALEVIEADFEEPGDEDVFRKVMADLEAKQVDISEHQLRKKMQELMAVAQQQIMQETPTT
jgi:hypothetical protein